MCGRHKDAEVWSSDAGSSSGQGRVEVTGSHVVKGLMFFYVAGRLCCGPRCSKWRFGTEMTRLVFCLFQERVVLVGKELAE